MTYKEHDEIEVQSAPSFSQNFTMVQNSVIECMGFAMPIDKLVYIDLMKYAFGDKRESYPSLIKVALAQQVSPNTVRTAIKRLVGMGLVEVIHRKNPNGTSRTNLYIVNDLTAELKANVVSNAEVFEKAKEGLKKSKGKKKEVAVKIVDNSKEVEEEPHSEYPPNFEPYPSNIEPYPSNSEVYPSNFEPKEYKTYNNTNFKNINHEENTEVSQSSLGSSIENDLNELMANNDFPKAIAIQIKNNKKRLTDNNISVYDIYAFYKSSDNTLTDSDFLLVITKMLKATSPIGSLIGYLKTAVANHYSEYDGLPKYAQNEEEEFATFDDVLDELHKRVGHKIGGNV